MGAYPSAHAFSGCPPDVLSYAGEDYGKAPGVCPNDVFEGDVAGGVGFAGVNVDNELSAHGVSPWRQV